MPAFFFLFNVLRYAKFIFWARLTLTPSVTTIKSVSEIESNPNRRDEMTPTYRIHSDTNPGDPKIAAAYARHGIVARWNAYAPRSRTRLVQVYRMSDGTIQPADSRIDQAVARDVNGLSR